MKINICKFLKNTTWFVVVWIHFIPNAMGQQATVSEPGWPWMNATISESSTKYEGQFLIGEGGLNQRTKSFIKDNYIQLADVRSDLKLRVKKQSLTGIHLTYVQMFNGVEIYGTEVKVNLTKDESISSSFVHLLQTEDWPTFVQQDSIRDKKNVILFSNNRPEPAFLFRGLNDHGELCQIIEDVNGQGFQMDLHRHKKGDSKDTIVWVSVFNPDPLTTAEVLYGGDYVNNSDNGSEALNAELQYLPVKMRYLSDSIWPESPFIKLKSILNDESDMPWARNDTFYVKREDDRFEFLMAYYHISTYKNTLYDLGFEDLMTYQILVYPRNVNSDDSYFQPDGNSEGTGTLNFGYSSDSNQHVDDAEDADVIIHEYGHAISHHANVNELLGKARKSVEEGVCDFLAAVYSHELSEFGSERVYSWDGHNPFWEGRICNTTLKGSEYSGSNTIYRNGEIISSALFDIYLELGAEVTQKIFLNSLYSYADRMDFFEAPKLFLISEKELYDGLYQDQICRIFTKYELVDKDVCISGFQEKNERLSVKIDHYAFRNNGALKIEFPRAFSGQIKLIDLTGRELYSTYVEQQEDFETQTQELPNGIYMVEIHNGWQSQSFKLIK